MAIYLEFSSHSFPRETLAPTDQAGSGIANRHESLVRPEGFRECVDVKDWQVAISQRVALASTFFKKGPL